MKLIRLCEAARYHETFREDVCRGCAICRACGGTITRGETALRGAHRYLSSFLDTEVSVLIWIHRHVCYASRVPVGAAEVFREYAQEAKEAREATGREARNPETDPEVQTLCSALFEMAREAGLEYLDLITYLRARN